MSEKSSIAEIKPRRAGKVRRTLAVASTFLAAGGVVAAPAAHAESSSSSAEAAHSYLRNPHELPGLKTHLGKEALNKIKDSTLEIVFKPKVTPGSPDYGWSPNCTAVKVTIPGHADPYIMTAAHCFSALTGVQSGAFVDSLAPADLAENFTGNSPYDYAVVDPSVSYNNRLTQPVALIDQISIDTDNKDVALLHPVATSPNSTNPFNIRNFKDIPSIPLRVAEKAPLQGTPVALYGEPQANNFEPVSGSGVYLGRVSFNQGKITGHGPNTPAVFRQLDLVGINPSSTNVDNCNYGTSGSMALLPDGHLLGNLSVRSSDGYGVDKKMQWPDSIYFDDYWRPVWEQQLGVDLSGFSVICGYTVMDVQTPQQLFNGFSHPVPFLGK